jgi:hypothetical protein
MTLTRQEDIQRSRLLATIALLLSSSAVIGYTIFGLLRPANLYDPDTLVSLVGITGALITYLLNRANKYYLARSIHCCQHSWHRLRPYLPAGSTSMVVLSVLPVLLTAFFYSTRVVILVTVATWLCMPR